MSAPAAPVRESAEIFAVHRVGAYLQFTVIAPATAAGFAPGQLLAIAVGGPDSALLLRRIVAIADATPSSVYAGTVQFVVADADGDAGGRWLARCRPGDSLDVIGPLGVPFPLPAGPAGAVLVGVGHRAAPLVALARALTAHGSRVEVVLGAPTVSGLHGESALRRVSGRVTVTTDDGTAGGRGAVTGALPAAIERVGAEIVYACGPAPVLRAVGEIARRHAIHAQVALDVGPGCGIGVCGGCGVAVRGGTARCCVDGPVFDAAELSRASGG